MSRAEIGRDRRAGEKKRSESAHTERAQNRNPVFILGVLRSFSLVFDRAHASHFIDQMTAEIDGFLKDYVGVGRNSEEGDLGSNVSEFMSGKRRSRQSFDGLGVAHSIPNRPRTMKKRKGHPGRVTFSF